MHGIQLVCPHYHRFCFLLTSPASAEHWMRVTSQTQPCHVQCSLGFLHTSSAHYGRLHSDPCILATPTSALRCRSSGGPSKPCHRCALDIERIYPEVLHIAIQQKAGSDATGSKGIWTFKGPMLSASQLGNGLPKNDPALTTART